MESEIASSPPRNDGQDMTRPRCTFRIGFCPKYRRFAPADFECSENDCIEISEEEIEALRLKNMKDLDQTAAAKKMGVSQSTFQRVLSGAYKKVTESLVEGKILRITDNK
ncbi:MAG: DUF134 domain-containing protein [bacterium]|nr:DUF134 domain-containing protein [bacterium]